MAKARKKRPASGGKKAAKRRKKTRSQAASYLASLPPDSRRAARKLRQAIRAAVPRAVEGFSYGIPVFRFEGRALVWYAAWKDHCSLYPLNAAVRRAHGAELEDYKTSKGTVRFPLDRPPPIAFIRRLVKTRVAELREKNKQKAARTR